MGRAGNALLRSHGVSDKTNETLVVSTGVIGVNLPISKILAAIQAQSSPSLPSYALSSAPAAYEAAARNTYRMAGMDKGAGMIHPRMAGPDAVGGLHATLLGLIVTDAPLQLHLNRRGHVDERHDNCRAGAGAAEKSTTIEDVDEETDPDAYCVFRDELTDFAIDLAKLVVRDGEGATKFVEVCVEMTGFCLLLFVPFPVPDVPPLECSYSGYVFVLDLVELSQM
ncbi:hypothetical protein SCLCIDRAFT_26050 [Scleroderma citrinum Foug A]|uniref:Uncharacterized protein n=1 Tax=Scleroderma citrinum Foug A TaxID=1036808 RepID=A0A0C3DKQ2_9AGAM|nr:hypothetical protein SCLCIDRAFT_26050 [Scleroderma citrinum Foug A]